MRTPKEIDLNVFTARIRFIVWTKSPATQYTSEELNAAINEAFGADPWKDRDGNVDCPHILPTEKFEPTRSEVDGNQYVVTAQKLVEASQTRAFTKNVLAADKFLRGKPPRGSRNIYTHLSFSIVFG